MSTTLSLEHPTVRPQARGQAAARFLPLALACLLVVWLAVFIAYPAVAVLLRSFSTKTGGFTVAHYQSFFAKTYFLRSLLNTVVLGVTVTGLCIVLGFAVAYLVARGPRPLRLPLRALTLAPLIAPPYLFGLALIILAGRRGVLAQLLDMQIPSTDGWA